MNLVNMIFSDPVVWISLLGLTTVLSICGYYVWFFMKNIKESES